MNITSGWSYWPTESERAKSNESLYTNMGNKRQRIEELRERWKNGDMSRKEFEQIIATMEGQEEQPAIDESQFDFYKSFPRYVLDSPALIVGVLASIVSVFIYGYEAFLGIVPFWIFAYLLFRLTE